MITVGTCGNCGGPVQCPEFWGGETPPPTECSHCGAKPIEQYGPVLPMGRPSVPAIKKIRLTQNGGHAVFDATAKHKGGE